MKTLIACTLLVFASVLHAGTPATDAPWKNHTFLLVSPTSLDVAVVSRVQVWMETNLHYQVRSLRLDSWEGKDSVSQVTALAPQFLPGDIAVVILTDRLENPKSHAIIIPEVPVGLVNVTVLHTEDHEKFCRRLERQAMRIVGFKLGLEPTPMPFCALAPYTTLTQLDQMGRGFSPPAMAGYRAALEDRNLPLSPSADKMLPAALHSKLPSIPSMPALPAMPKAPERLK